MDRRNNFVWRMVIDSDSDDDDDDEVLPVYRREYKMYPRINLECWDFIQFHENRVLEGQFSWSAATTGSHNAPFISKDLVFHEFF